MRATAVNRIDALPAKLHRDPSILLDHDIAIATPSQHLRDEAEVRRVLEAQSLDADAVLTEIDAGAAIEVVQAEHERGVREHHVWGVPTFIVDDQATFVRYMDRPQGDAERAVATIERTLDVITGWPELNELKHTSIPR